jgi:hypothetical protein
MNLDVPDAAIAAMEKSGTVLLTIDWSGPRDRIVARAQYPNARRRVKGAHAEDAAPSRVSKSAGVDGLGWVSSAWGGSTDCEADTNIFCPLFFSESVPNQSEPHALGSHIRTIITAAVWS